jgi:hypothetical protein
MGELIYNAGGWGGTGDYWVQRIDQGQDFEIPLGHFITAPGDATVVAHSSDAPFPGGFGSPYAIVEVHSGRFAVGNGQWYVGHCNQDVAPVGTRLKLGDPIARANNSLNAGRGWCELGKWDGGPHPMGEGAQWAYLFTPLVVKPPFKPLRHGSRGIRVVKLTRRLHYIRRTNGPAYLRRSYVKYKTDVVSAVRDFQRDHGLSDDGVVGEHTWEAIQKAFRKQRANRH